MTDIVLWLDLADGNQIEDDAIREHFPPAALVLRLTDCGVERCPRGTPVDWRPALDGIDRLVRRARKLEATLPKCRYWVTGRAGLPAFFHLAHRLSKLAAVTFLHQATNGGAVEVLRLEATHESTDPWFERTPWPVPLSTTHQPVALVVSSLRRPDEALVDRALLERRQRPGAVMHAHAPRRMEPQTVGRAIAELDVVLRETCDSHPLRATLALFMAGPSSLAFLVGAAVNPRACRDVQIFEYHGGRYSLAYELPYPSIPERAVVLFWRSVPHGTRALQLDEEQRRLQHELDRDGLEIVDVPAARPFDLSDRLRKRTANVMHFSGHGEVGQLCFQTRQGELRPVSTADLTEVVRLAGGAIQLVVLAACHTESLARALLAHVGCVVAARGPFDDVDAIHFTAAFYRQVATGDSVRRAFDWARSEMRLKRGVGGSDGRSREVVAGHPVDEEEAVQLFERDEGCADELFLTRTRR